MALKRRMYIALTIVLGIMLSYIAHGAIEIVYLQFSNSITWHMHWGVALCALPPILAYALFGVGVVGGYFLGVWWWKLVYIEKKHWHR